MSLARAARQPAIPSWWLLPVAAVMLLAPNGMNRTGLIGELYDAQAAAVRLFEHARPYLGTRVAAKCIARDGTTTYVDPGEDCPSATRRADVFVLPMQNIADGVTPGERANLLHTQIGSAAAAQQCTALEDLLREIDGEAKRPGPPARLDELLALRQRAITELQRLLC